MTVTTRWLEGHTNQDAKDRRPHRYDHASSLNESPTPLEAWGLDPLGPLLQTQWNATAPSVTGEHEGRGPSSRFFKL